MNKALFAIAFALGAVGVWLMIDAGLSWKAVLGLALIMWGNNIGRPIRTD